MKHTLYLIISLLIAGCSTLGTRAGESAQLSAYPLSFVPVISGSVAYCELNGKFPQDPHEFASMIDSLKAVPKSAKFNFMSADSICLKANICSPDDKPDSDSYYEIIKSGAKYTYVLILNNFIAKLDSVYLQYDHCRLKGGISLERGSDGKFKITGDNVVESISGSMSRSH
ncbi:MAG TPA: hypothetical protein VHO28_03290 [Ignavibacteriales bacterium]|nr:hypothetical protein [Ignavibacteriales bacterium]